METLETPKFDKQEFIKLLDQLDQDFKSGLLFGLKVSSRRIEDISSHEPMMVLLENWFKKQPLEAKLASLLLVELKAKQHKLPDRTIGNKIYNEMQESVWKNGSGPQELGFLRGIYKAFSLINV